MTIEDTLALIRKQYPNTSKKETYDVDKDGNDFCEVIIPDVKRNKLPITVTINKEGCFLSVGRMHNISGKYEISVENLFSAIDDVINDRIVFVYKYKNEENKEDGHVSECDFFPLTGRKDDMLEEFEKFKSKLLKEKSKKNKIFSKYKGIYEISSYTGKYDEVIEVMQ